MDWVNQTAVPARLLVADMPDGSGRGGMLVAKATKDAHGHERKVGMEHSHAERAGKNDHPGLYPRNPFGKGYVVHPEMPDNEVELPNLEDPSDRLTPEHFFVRDPKLWFQQPLPWCLDWSSALMCRRYVWLGADAWFLAPEDALLPEVRRGLLPPRFREAADELEDALGAPLPFLQEASLGMVVHARIPLALRIDDDPPIHYECPPTIGEAYRAQQKGGAP